MGLGAVEATVDEATVPCLDSTITVKTKDRILRQLWLEITRDVRGE